ncbi:MAG: Protein of unknown function (DUF1587)/Protein of unknown function (DUF1592)/Protein of unknown [Phycisphaerales bacterium]|nr:Protein of unknown function (DUF1587)/Protein of unknown function (DUF1592)/Protein of unknown [Phycisphaerales bacterium]
MNIFGVGRTRWAAGWVGVCAVVGTLTWGVYRTHGADAAKVAGDDKAPAANAPPDDGSAAAIAEAQKQWDSQIKPFLAQYCFQCHGNGKHKGDIVLDGYTTLASIQKDHRVWRTVADVLSQKAMPPENKPQPGEAQSGEVVRWISQAMSLCDCSGPRDPGRVAIHRLNKNEYNNTIRDLVGVDFEPAKDFPADDTGYGFDNIADVLSMSPLLAEKYVSAAEQVLDKALVAESISKPRTKRYETAGLDATGSNAGGDLLTNGEVYGTHYFPVTGDYDIRLRAGQDKFLDEDAKMVLKFDDKELKEFDVAAPRRAAKVYKFRLTKVEKGKHKFAAAYTNNAVDRENPDPDKRGDRNLYVETIEIEGPFNVAPGPPPESFTKIFFVTPGPNLSEPAARKIVEKFATRAFRRPASAEEMEALMRVYRSALSDGSNYTDAVKVALEAALVSPQFLYRIEADPSIEGMTLDQIRNAPAHPITDYELATRLSYFLWSSMPDDELLQLAGEQKLHTAAVLEKEINRMLADPKSGALVSNFVGQWLEIRNLDYYRPDPGKFPQYDSALRNAMRREAEMFFENMVKEDRSVLELLDCDYTFVNARLAKHYGIEGVKGDEFRRVSLSEAGEAGKHRGGVLTMGGVLTVTAMPTRTSPVKRGKFVLEQILGTPPPPPPPEVPALPDKPRDQKSASVRQRLERHRADPTCASCHMRMDPLGFAMENFDALGAWREKDGGFPVDPTGKLPDGTALDGPDGVKKALMARKELFVRCLAEKLLTYALGRGTEYYDTCTVRDIAQNVQKNDYRFSAMIGAVVKSDAFLKRRPFADPKVEKDKIKEAAAKDAKEDGGKD